MTKIIEKCGGKSKPKQKPNGKRRTKESIQDIPREHRTKWWYLTKHGLGGSLPRGVEILDVIEDGWDTWVLLNNRLTPDEIDEYDLKAKNPPYELLKNSREMQRHRSGISDYLTFDYNDDGTVNEKAKARRTNMGMMKESVSARNGSLLDFNPSDLMRKVAETGHSLFSERELNGIIYDIDIKYVEFFGGLGIDNEDELYNVTVIKEYPDGKQEYDLLKNKLKYGEVVKELEKWKKETIAKDEYAETVDDGVNEMNGYKFQTTFWNDFSIADKFGANAVKDTYKRAFNEWKDDYIYLTELVLVLNWKCWQHYEDGNQKLSEVYSDLFYKAQDYAYENLEGDELSYFYRTTD